MKFYLKEKHDEIFGKTYKEEIAARLVENHEVDVKLFNGSNGTTHDAYYQLIYTVLKPIVEVFIKENLIKNGGKLLKDASSAIITEVKDDLKWNKVSRLVASIKKFTTGSAA